MAKTGLEKRDKKHRICKKRGLREEGERGEANNSVGRGHLREGEGRRFGARRRERRKKRRKRVRARASVAGGGGGGLLH